jgi:hypothetical protein
VEDDAARSEQVDGREYVPGVSDGGFESTQIEKCKRQNEK